MGGPSGALGASAFDMSAIAAGRLGGVAPARTVCGRAFCRRCRGLTGASARRKGLLSANTMREVTVVESHFELNSGQRSFQVTTFAVSLNLVYTSINFGFFLFYLYPCLWFAEAYSNNRDCIYPVTSGVNCALHLSRRENIRRLCSSKGGPQHGLLLSNRTREDAV